MKEKLSEIIQKAVGGCAKYWADVIAEKLVAEGVIVPLCKVGDTVYQTDGIRIYELEVFDVSLKNYKPYYETEGIDFDDTAIGKSIFLTREDAEKALQTIPKMENRELKPCKCGCEAELVDIQAFAWCDTYYFVRCTNPDCEERTPRCEYKSDAILAWNRRAENGKS